MEQALKKRWIRGSRTDMVKENGKTYYKICKCGSVKESYKMPMCKSCDKEYSKKRAKSKIKYEASIKDLVVRRSDKSEGKINYKQFLISFVNKIERRNGLASLEDIFVDMITLFNYYGCNQDIDVLPTDIQLKLMWDYLRDYKIKLENGKK